jgi:hypothetical protein
MAVVAAIAGLAGAAVQIYGNVTSANAQSAAERANAAFYREQSEFARRAMMREYNIYNDQAAEFTGEVISQAGKGGAELSGSPLLALGTILARQEAERQAILEDGNFKVREAILRAEASEKAARSMKNSAVISSFGIGLSGIASAAGAFAAASSAPASAGGSSSGWLDFKTAARVP